MATIRCPNPDLKVPRYTAGSLISLKCVVPESLEEKNPNVIKEKKKTLIKATEKNPFTI